MAEIKIVSNTTGKHLDQLKILFDTAADRLIIVSPYLSSDIKTLLREFTFTDVKIVVLITTIKPKDPEQHSKPRIIKDFFDFFREKGIKVKLHIDNKLHGKIYFKEAGLNKTLILSSANFTHNGLYKNHEWGLQITENTVVSSIIEDVLRSIEYEDVTYNQIKKACQFAEHYLQNNPDWLPPEHKVHTDILDNVYTVEDSSNTDPQYILKPIGYSKSPVLIEDQEDFSDFHQNLHFSKTKPKNVRKGDIVITTGVGSGSLLSYFKVTGSLYHVTDEEVLHEKWKERWPWYMEARNLSPDFGKEWWVHNIQREDVLTTFCNKYPKVPVTTAGGFTLGALNWGSDKIQITKEFGEFLISKIDMYRNIA